MIFFCASCTAPFRASLLSFRSATSELSAVVVVFTSAVLLATAAAAFASAVDLPLASAAAAALLASPICASRLASSSCSCLICCCCASRVWRNASICSARSVVADFAGVLWSSLPFPPVADHHLSVCPQTPFPTSGIATIRLLLFFSFPLSLTASRSSFRLLLQFKIGNTGESACLPAGKRRASVLLARQSNVNIL